MTPIALRNALFDELTAARDRHISGAKECNREAEGLEERANALRAAAIDHEQFATAYDTAITRALVPITKEQP